MRTCVALHWIHLPSSTFIFVHHLSISMNDKSWFLETYNQCVDVNPNSNGTLSQQAVVNSKEFTANNFLMASRPMAKGRGTVHTRNIKTFNNCVNACHTKEQEELLAKTLDELHLELMAIDGNKKKSAASNTSVASKTGSTKSDVSTDTGGKRKKIGTLAAVEKASTYSRKAPPSSPSFHK